jgi:hypothetical protein
MRVNLGYFVLGAVLLAAAACSDATSTNEFESTGGGGSGVGAQGGTSGQGGSGGLGGVFDAGGTGGSTGDGCAEETRFVYVVDSDNKLYKFDPSIQSNAAFQLIGTMGCEGGDGPNSMSVGRDGYAYVLYGTQDPFSTNAYDCAGVFKVDIKTAACAGPSAFQCGSAGFEKFGMGFSTDTAGSTAEALYLSNSLSPKLGKVELTTGQVTVVGNQPGAAEFTGNANGELWGFFPDQQPPAVLQVDKSNGAILTTYSLSTLPPLGVGGYAYAFAFWGGSFYIFYQVDDYDTSTNVWKLDAGGAVSKYIPNTGLRIVGAGVSTCAPVEPPK